MNHRSTFALDEATIERLKRLAKAWNVSQAEVVRRSLERAEQADLQGTETSLARLHAYHAAGGLDPRAADTWLEEVAETRGEWRRGE